MQIIGLYLTRRGEEGIRVEDRGSHLSFIGKWGAGCGNRSDVIARVLWTVAC